MILFKNKPNSSTIAPTVAGLRLAKDMDDLIMRRYFAQYAQFFVSAPYTQDNKIHVPVSFKVKPESGSIYSGCVFDTVIIIQSSYPFTPPSMIVRNQVYHPNIDIDSGLVSLRILKLIGWIPILTINSIIFAFEVILHSPDLDCVPENLVNLEMKEIFLNNYPEFVSRVKTTINGAWVLERYLFEKNYGSLPNFKRMRQSSCENTKRSRIGYEESEMKIEICLENN